MKLFHRRLKKLKRAPKIFIPTPSRWQVVVPFRPLSTALIALLLLLCGFLALRSDVFLIKSVRCGTDEVCRAVETSLVGRSIFFLDEAGLQSKIRREFLVVESLKIKRRPPGAVEVTVVRRRPLAVLKPARLLVDGRGLVYAEALGGEELPTINLGEREAKVGDRLSDQDIRLYLSLLGKINETKMAVEEVKMATFSSAISLKLKSGPLVLFSTRKSADEQIASLQTILHYYKIRGTDLLGVDLRFDKPVVK